MRNPTPFTYFSAALSNVGKRRKVNEDALLSRPEIGLWAVADGMGGYDAGDVASATIIDALQSIPSATCMSEFVNNVEQHLLGTNTQIYQQYQQINRISGSTIAALLMLEYHCAVVWAGDSRVYRYRNGQLQQLMQDHSEVEELVAKGELSRTEAETLDDHTITRAVGAEEKIFFGITLYPIQHDDIFLLCSDGLYREVTESEIIDIFSQKTNCHQATQSLVDLVLSRRAKDNVSVIVTHALATNGQLEDQPDERLKSLTTAYEKDEYNNKTYHHLRDKLINELTEVNEEKLLFPHVDVSQWMDGLTPSTTSSKNVDQSLISQFRNILIKTRNNLLKTKQKNI